MLMVKSLGMILKNIYSALEIKICNIKGFSFILDTNDEYDVKNLFQRKSRHVGSRLPVDHGAGQTVPPRQGENHRGCQGRSEGFQSDQMDLPCH